MSGSLTTLPSTVIWIGPKLNSIERINQSSSIIVWFTININVIILFILRSLPVHFEFSATNCSIVSKFEISKEKKIKKKIETSERCYNISITFLRFSREPNRKCTKIQKLDNIRRTKLPSQRSRIFVLGRVEFDQCQFCNFQNKE